MLRKGIPIMVRLFLTASLLTSCSTATKGSGSKEGAVSAGDPKPTADERAELVFFSNSKDSEESFNDRFGNAIRKKFPNYTIKYIVLDKGSSLPELIAAGTPVDIYWESVGQFMDGTMKYNMQLDMTDLIKKHKIDLNRFEPTTIDAMKMMSGGGKLYGLPVSNNNLALFYNKDLFDKFGVPYPKDGMTWDELLDLNKKLTRSDGSKQYAGLGMSYTHFVRLNPFSLPFMDPKTEKAMINTDERWKTEFTNGFLKPAEAPGYKEKMQANGNKMLTSKSFLQDKDLAMFAYLSFWFTTEETLSSMNWDMVALPTYKEAPGIGSQSYPTYFSVTSTSKYKDQATEVIKFLTSDEHQTELSKKGIMPVVSSDAVKKVFGQESKFKDKNLKSVFVNKLAPISAKTTYDAALEKIYVKDVANLALGTVNLNNAFREAEDAGNKAIADAKSK